MEELLRILEKNARMPIEDIAAMLDKTPEEIAAMMDEAAAKGYIRGYETLVDWEQAGVGCVLGAAQLKAADACIADAPRRFKVRLANAQRDAVRHFSRQIKEPADAGRAHRLGGRGKQFIVVHHRTVHSLSSGSSARYSRPPRL